MSTETGNPTKDALLAFMGQLDAHTLAIHKVASYLEDEGIRSYARPLRAASRNIDHAFADLRHDLGAWESAERIPDDHFRALGRLIHATALAADGELTNPSTRSRRAIMGDLYEDVEAAYRWMLAMRDEDWDEDMDARLEEVNVLRQVGAE